MATVRFNLRKHKNSLPSIQLIYRLESDKRKLVLGTGLNVADKNWNPKTMRYRITHDSPEAESHNAILDQWETAVNNVVKQNLLTKKNPSLNQFRLSVINHMTGEILIKATNELLPFFESFIKSKKPKVEKVTLKQYNNAYNHLTKYINKKHSGKKLDFSDVSLEFLQGFNDYLESLGHEPNTINKTQKRIVSVMNKAKSKGIAVNNAYKDSDWKVSYTKQPKIYLSEQEIQSIRNLELEDKSRLDKLRDILLIGLSCGLRYSDLTRLTTDMIMTYPSKKLLKIRLKKGKNWVLIPLKSEVLQIVKKYDGFPPMISLKNFNLYLKELCKMASIDSTVSKVKDGEQVFYPKHELVTSHICRRSFATNGFKAGIPAKLLRDITGHSTNKQFLEYVQIDEEESAELLASHDFFK